MRLPQIFKDALSSTLVRNLNLHKCHNREVHLSSPTNQHLNHALQTQQLRFLIRSHDCIIKSRGTHFACASLSAEEGNEKTGLGLLCCPFFCGEIHLLGRDRPVPHKLHLLGQIFWGQTHLLVKVHYGFVGNHSDRQTKLMRDCI